MIANINDEDARTHTYQEGIVNSKLFEVKEQSMLLWQYLQTPLNADSLSGLRSRFYAECSISEMKVRSV